MNEPEPHSEILHAHWSLMAALCFIWRRVQNTTTMHFIRAPMRIPVDLKQKTKQLVHTRTTLSAVFKHNALSQKSRGDRPNVFKRTRAQRSHPSSLTCTASASAEHSLCSFFCMTHKRLFTPSPSECSNKQTSRSKPLAIMSAATCFPFSAHRHFLSAKIKQSTSKHAAIN